MIEILTIGAVAVLVILTIGTLFPFVPSGILSALTIGIYWWQTGYSEPGIVIVVSLIILSLLVTVTDLVSGAVAGKMSGASNTSVGVGTLVGTILLFIFGPIGFIVGIAGVVFIFSVYDENEDYQTAIKRSLVTVVGVLGSRVVQFIMLLVVTAVFAFFVL